MLFACVLGSARFFSFSLSRVCELPKKRNKLKRDELPQNTNHTQTPHLKQKTTRIKIGKNVNINHDWRLGGKWFRFFFGTIWAIYWLGLMDNISKMHHSMFVSCVMLALRLSLFLLLCISLSIAPPSCSPPLKSSHAIWLSHIHHLSLYIFNFLLLFIYSSIWWMPIVNALR